MLVVSEDYSVYFSICTKIDLGRLVVIFFHTVVTNPPLTTTAVTWKRQKTFGEDVVGGFDILSAQRQADEFWQERIRITKKGLEHANNYKGGKILNL